MVSFFKGVVNDSGFHSSGNSDVSDCLLAGESADFPTDNHSGISIDFQSLG